MWTNFSHMWSHMYHIYHMWERSHFPILLEFSQLKWRHSSFYHSTKALTLPFVSNILLCDKWLYFAAMSKTSFKCSFLYLNTSLSCDHSSFQNKSGTQIWELNIRQNSAVNGTLLSLLSWNLDILTWEGIPFPCFTLVEKPWSLFGHSK